MSRETHRWKPYPFPAESESAQRRPPSVEVKPICLVSVCLATKARHPPRTFSLRDGFKYRIDVRCGFLLGTPAADAPTRVCNFPFAYMKTNSQSVGFSHNGTHLSFAKLMSLIPKTKEVLRVGLGFQTTYLF